MVKIASKTDQKVDLKDLLLSFSPHFDDTESLYRQFDSLQLVELVSRIEREFKVNLPSFAITPENFENLESLEKLIQRQRGLG